MKRIRNKFYGNDESEENLRGKLREQKKQLETQNRYIKHLEKQVSRQSPKKTQISKQKELDDKSLNCPKCGSADYQPQSFWSPKKEIWWMICKKCKYKEKIP